MNLDYINSTNSIQRDPYKDLKIGIWLYFFLLIFEGALRKWFLPALATPLLIVRDPIALWLLFRAHQKGLFAYNGYIVVMGITSFIALVTSLLFGHQNLNVALYGLRILVIHFPLMFVIGRVFTREDIIKLGKVVIYLSVPMLILITLQFYSPQSAWVNRGVGGDVAGAGFSGALDFFRPPGTFSFTLGNSMFWGFTAPFVFYFWLVPQQINKLFLLGATAALLLSIPISISRTLMFEVAQTFVFTLFIMIQKPKYIGSMVITLAALFLLIGILSLTSVFQTGTEVFTTRLTNASGDEGGLQGTLVDRFLGGLIGPIAEADKIPFFGYGIGMGTNAGAMLLTGKVDFLIAEVEWGRLIGEMGMLLGLIVIAIRISFVYEITVLAYKKLATDDFLPWLLVSFGFLTILQTQWAQPTVLGFSTLIGGLILASLKNKKTLALKENIK
ncbi:hypothetical protein [Flavobacterium sp.]|uniref:hypothetical protein n=1 Tax=Flavobacterium sp. TaxID=239 RepID=UPI002CE3FAD6|nr:hypothetical protein [Flavobacterium sp.]HSD06038.1 hypothetical protein [Flavobacterium sp.]